MKRNLQCISLAVALLSVMASCDKDKAADNSTNITPPPPPPLTGSCDSSNRPRVSAQLVPVGKLSKARGGVAVAAVGSKILFAGGYGSTRVDIYDVTANSWSTDTLRYPMGSLTGVAVAGQIYWAEECLVEIKNVQTVSSTFSSLFTSAYWQDVDGQSAVVKNNKIIFCRHNTDKTKWFDIYDTSIKRWSIGEMSITVVEASIISVNNTIYLAGGSIDGVASDQVWKLEF
jgi:hypothetical protein